jgi:hypothetical protein
VHAWRTRRGQRVGAWVSYAAAAGFIVSTILAVRYQAWPPDEAWGPKRASLLKSLEAEPGRFVVFVRSLPGTNRHAGWVYNAADIDAAKVVWAHDLGTEKNRELLAYFPDRDPFLLEVGELTASFQPYPR